MALVKGCVVRRLNIHVFTFGIEIQFKKESHPNSNHELGLIKASA